MPSQFAQILGCLLGCGRKPLVLESVPTESEYENKNPHCPSTSVSSLENDVLRSKKSPSVKPRPRSEVNRALVVVENKQYQVLEAFPYPTLQTQKEVIIRTKAVGLNPIDWKSVDYGFCLPEFPWITGREMAGVVEEVGSEVIDIKVGQKVWTSTYYRDRRAGCFQDFVTVPEHTVVPLPSTLTFESASCLGVAGLTAAMALWKWLQVPGSPTAETHTIPDGGYILIWGGSAITGQFAIQIAVAGGLKVIAVTSEKTKPLAESLGAQVVTRDGKSGDEIVAEIRNIAGDEITRGIDLVGTSTAVNCLKALSTTQKALFAPLAMMSNKAVIPSNISVETVEMKQFVLDPASKVYAHALNTLIEDGTFIIPDLLVLKGGLGVVEDGLERVKKGDMDGKRVIVSFD